LIPKGEEGIIEPTMVDNEQQPRPDQPMRISRRDFLRITGLGAAAAALAACRTSEPEAPTTPPSSEATASAAVAAPTIDETVIADAVEATVKAKADATTGAAKKETDIPDATDAPAAAATSTPAATETAVPTDIPEATPTKTVEPKIEMPGDLRKEKRTPDGEIIVRAEVLIDDNTGVDIGNAELQRDLGAFEQTMCDIVSRYADIARQPTGLNPTQRQKLIDNKNHWYGANHPSLSDRVTDASARYGTPQLDVKPEHYGLDENEKGGMTVDKARSYNRTEGIDGDVDTVVIVPNPTFFPEGSSEKDQLQKSLDLGAVIPRMVIAIRKDETSNRWAENNTQQVDFAQGVVNAAALFIAASLQNGGAPFPHHSLAIQDLGRVMSIDTEKFAPAVATPTPQQ
jgi:hypothetical protein